MDRGHTVNSEKGCNRKVLKTWPKGYDGFNKHRIKWVLAGALLVWYYFSLPGELFNDPYATVIESREGQLLGAKIASDGQWRFPRQDSLPDKFRKCIIAFEDQYFYRHPGFNPVSMWKAFRQNNNSRKIVRGGSTITQQVIRLSRKNRTRTYWEKVKEVILATRLEWRCSKDEILNLYVSHAPFGGNVVGLEMASWRYFGVPAHRLSWGETATLAVLPNAPSLIYPGKNQDILLMKRNGLLKKLKDQGEIDELTFELAIKEPLPEKPFNLPQTAPHLLQNAALKYEGQRIKTSIQESFQKRINQLAARYYSQYKQNEIYNLAILVIDVENRKVLSYIGNAPTDSAHQKDVDVIHAPRSTGSILKPLLYSAILDEGELLPNQLVPDVPTQISGYSPQNFKRSFDGAVPAGEALSRSLNIPFVLLLQEYGVPRFYEYLQRYGLRDISKPPGHYGLSLILGGAESNLWDLCQAYCGLTGTLNYYLESGGKYRKKEWAPISYLQNYEADFGEENFYKNIVGAGSVYSTYEALKQISRPEEDEAWELFDSSVEIAWKTGTSFGNRDAWAIGTNDKFVVGVWVGNATGEGRPMMTGISTAAPVLFEVFGLLPKRNWFEKPLNDMEEVEVCLQSGYLAKEGCEKKLQWIPLRGKESTVCLYHKMIHLNGGYRVNSSCESIDGTQSVPWFVLPPVMEWYYLRKNADYAILPPFRDDCVQSDEIVMEFIYPKSDSKVYLTRHFDGNPQPIVIKVAHSKPGIKLFWYLDDKYLGVTQTFHEMTVYALSGRYLVSVTDENGKEIRRNIEIVERGE